MSRADTIKQERRRRNTDALGGKRRRLAVTGQLDHENFAYRWVNDEDTRLHDLTVNDDWEVVSDRSGTLKSDGAGTGAEISVPVGMGTKAPMKAVLLRKRKDWYDDDKRAEQRRIDETEASLKSGAVPGAGSDQSYVPRGGITFDHGSRS